MSNVQSRTRRATTWTALSMILTGTAFQIPSCSSFLTVFNPCGTVFAFCNAREIDALFGDVPDFNLDPSCTIPFFGVDNDDAGGGNVGGQGGGQGGGGGFGGGGGGFGGGFVGGQAGVCSNQEIFPTTPGPRP